MSHCLQVLSITGELAAASTLFSGACATMLTQVEALEACIAKLGVAGGGTGSAA